MLRTHTALCWTSMLVGGLTMIAPRAAAQQFVEQTATRFPQPDPLEYSNQCTVGDIDGDGDLDILIANGGNFNSPGTPQKLRVYINNGQGVFTDETDARTGGLTFLARGVELGDVERDGDLDVIVAQDFNRQPTLLINNGKGFFTDETNDRLPIGTFSSTRAQFGDVDNDGDLDLYLTNGGNVSRWGSGRGKLWLNDGNGVFTDVTLTNTPNQNVSEPQDCIFGDIDGDFDLDLRIGSTASNQSKLYRNNGEGVFTSIASPSDNNCYSYDFGDIDGDGDLDLLGANAHPSNINSELLLRNNGSGSFSSISFPLNTTDDNDSKFIDFDNDGDLDLLIGSLGSTERIYTNNGSGTFTLTGGIIQAISDATLDIKVADFDGDGRYDIVTMQGEGGNFTNRIYRNVSGPVDTQAPRIVRTEQLKDTQDAVGPYPVRVVIYDSHTSDRGFHDKGVLLNYLVEPGEAKSVPMDWVGNSMWRGELPGQPAGSHVQYWVTATDFVGNTGEGSVLSFTILSPPCPADTNGSGTVDVADLLAVINAWGETATTHHVAVRNFEFDPQIVNARAGDTIQWNWEEGFHTVTSGEIQSCSADNVHFNHAISSADPTYAYVLPSDFSGPLPYFCVPHCPGMSGTINVAPFVGEVTGDGVVNVQDLLAVVSNWGPCP